jgi:hypothetical protein
VNMTGPIMMLMVMVAFLSLHGRVVNHGCPFHQMLDMRRMLDMRGVQSQIG